MKKEILIVDDDERILVVWQGALHKYSDWWNVRTASNGCEALELAHRMDFDLVVTDLRMPIMDGCGLTEALRALRPQARIVWISGFPDEELESKAARLGVEQCLKKPLTVAQIRQAVADALGISHLLSPSA